MRALHRLPEPERPVDRAGDGARLAEAPDRQLGEGEPPTRSHRARPARWDEPPRPPLFICQRISAGRPLFAPRLRPGSTVPGAAQRKAPDLRWAAAPRRGRETSPATARHVRRTPRLGTRRGGLMWPSQPCLAPLGDASSAARSPPLRAGWSPGDLSVVHPPIVRLRHHRGCRLLGDRVGRLSGALTTSASA